MELTLLRLEQIITAAEIQCVSCLQPPHLATEPCTLDFKLEEQDTVNCIFDT